MKPLSKRDYHAAIAAFSFCLRTVNFENEVASSSAVATAIPNSKYFKEILAHGYFDKNDAELLSGVYRFATELKNLTAESSAVSDIFVVFNEIDLVVNSTYSYQHAPISIDLLDHGFNVVCEKRCAFNSKIKKCRKKIKKIKKVVDRCGFECYYD